MNIVIAVICFVVGFAIGSVCGVVVTSFHQLGKMEDKINQEDSNDEENY